MKDNRVIKIVILLITLVMVNLVAFLSIHTYTASRIINIIFLNLAVIVFEGFMMINTKSKDNKYLNYTKIPLVTTYSLITFILSIVLLVVNPSIVITIILQAIITAIFCIVMLTNKMADNSTEQAVSQMKEKITDTKAFSNQLKNILQTIKDRELYKKVEKVYDASRSLKINIQSDATDLDKQISADINKLENYIQENNVEEIEKTIENISRYFIKRNSL